MAHQVVWLDIPVNDLERAIGFYSAVLNCEVKREAVEDKEIAVLPCDEGCAGACLFHREGEKPSATGPLFYLNAQGRLDEAVKAVEDNGGKVLKPKHPLGPYGFSAVVLDSEGNRFALHSM